MSDIQRLIADFLHEEADGAPRPDARYERVLHKAKVRRAMTAVLGGLAVVAVIMASVVTADALRAPSTIDPAGAATPAPSATSREIRGCPVTIPPRAAFVPPQPYPSRFPNPNVPDADDRQWYGSAGLWTALDSQGEVWQDLPDDDGNGEGFTKTSWWSEAYPPDNGPVPPITVSGERLDGRGSFETRASGGGFREDIRSFMLVGIEMPPGCWDLTASYLGTELSYVVLVED